jgi:hypothetical protein
MTREIRFFHKAGQRARLRLDRAGPAGTTAHAGTMAPPALSGMVGITAATEDNRERALRCAFYTLPMKRGANRWPASGPWAK